MTSHSNFSSVRGNVCVFAGKWAYEATLGSSGIMQLGWATIRQGFPIPHSPEPDMASVPALFACSAHVRVRLLTSPAAG